MQEDTSYVAIFIVAHFFVKLKSTLSEMYLNYLNRLYKRRTEIDCVLPSSKLSIIRNKSIISL